MDFAALKKMVAKGEGRHLEFKRKVADPLKVAREVVAFANTEGGMLLIGVSDDGVLAGLKEPEEEIFVMKNVLSQHCKPAIDYQIEIVALSDRKQIVIFHISEQKEKPVFLLYNLRRQTGRAYLRVEDKSVQMSTEARRILKARSALKDSVFQYGAKEQLLLKHLALVSKTDKKTFAAAAQITEQEAADVLVNLTISSVLELHPQEELDYFTLKESSEKNILKKKLII